MQCELVIKSEKSLYMRYYGCCAREGGGENRSCDLSIHSSWIKQAGMLPGERAKGSQAPPWLRELSFRNAQI